MTQAEVQERIRQLRVRLEALKMQMGGGLQPEVPQPGSETVQASAGTRMYPEPYEPKIDPYSAVSQGGGFAERLGRDVARLPVHMLAFGEQAVRDPGGAAKGFGEFVGSGARRLYDLSRMSPSVSNLQDVTGAETYRQKQLAEEFKEHPFETAMHVAAPVLLARGGIRLGKKIAKGVPGDTQAKAGLLRRLKERKEARRAVQDGEGGPQAAETGGVFQEPGVVPEWGTRNQYYVNNPFRKALDKMSEAGKFDEVVLRKAGLWEMEQVLKDKPAYLNDSHFIPATEVLDFAKKNNLPAYVLPNGDAIVGKTLGDIRKVVKARGNQRELGLALGYEDLRVMPDAGVVDYVAPVEMEAGGLSAVGDMLDRSLTNDPATSLAKTAQKSVAERAGSIAVEAHESRLFTERLRKATSASERQDMIYVRQKTGNPFKKGDTYETARSRLSEKAQGYLSEIDTRIKKTWNELVDLDIYEYESWIADYLHQAWDMSKKDAKSLATGFKTSPPKGRKLRTFHEGITEKGYKPRFTDMAELLEHQDRLLTTVKYNRRLVQHLKSWKDPDTGQRQLMVPRKGTVVPEDYTFIESKALAKAIDPRSEYPGAYVHPEIASAMKAVFNRPPVGKIGNTIDWFNAIAKKSALSISLFHHIALSESAGAVGRPILGMLTGPAKAYKGYKMLRDPAFYKEPLQAGLQVGSTADMNLLKINRMLNAAVRRTSDVPVVGQVMKGIRGFNELWDKGLWDFYHNGLKTYYYWATKERLIRKNPQVDSKVIAQETAKVMNDAFGGQAWEQMLVDPKILRMAQRVFLAPDWTLSNIRIAYRALESGRGKKITQKLRLKEPELAKELQQRASLRGQIGRRYAFNMALQYFFVTQALNYAFSGKPTWENPPGQKTSISLGKNLYMKPFKQAREPFRYIIDIMEAAPKADMPKIIGYKLSPFIHTMTEQIFGKSTTGWQMPWQPRYPGQRVEASDEWRQRAVALGEKVLPFAARRVIPGISKEPLPVGYAGVPFPISKGLTPYKFRVKYEDALRDGDKKKQAELRAAAIDAKVPNLKSLIQKAHSAIQREQEGE